MTGIEWLTISILDIGLVCTGLWLGRKISLLLKQPRIIYAVDMSLQLEDESIDDFIYRAYNERLGEYRVV